MREVSIDTRWLSVKAKVPDSVARAVHAVKTRRAPAGSAGDPYYFETALPTLDLKTRDLDAALAHCRPGPPAPPAGPGASELARRVAEISWYHTIELPEGVVTPGVFDLRPLIDRYAMPMDLTGQRVFDVNTFDGFWAFEFEKRGADVVAGDIPRFSCVDFPPAMRTQFEAEGLDAEIGIGFRLAQEALGSKVQYEPGSVYDLDPAKVGTFDITHVGDLLLHLRDPVAALYGVRRVTGGRAVIVDCFDPKITGHHTRYEGGWNHNIWWLPSLDTLAQMVLDAGFADVEIANVFRYGDGGLWRASLIATT